MDWTGAVIFGYFVENLNIDIYFLFVMMLRQLLTTLEKGNFLHKFSELLPWKG